MDSSPEGTTLGDMKRTWTKQISLAIFVTFVSGAALGQELDKAADSSRLTFGSNLFRDPCTTCRYSEGGGYFVLGPDNCFLPGTTQWLAVPFVAAANGIPERVSAAIILGDPANCPADQVTLSIYTDACYPKGPGRPLVSAVASAVEAPCDLAVARLGDAPALVQGKKYWVVATTDAQQSALDANWYGSNNAQYANNTGTGWQQFVGGTPAFRVQGSGTVFSEPSPDSSHPAFGGNLFVDPCTGCNYDPNGSGFPVWGPENCTSPGELQSLAVPFIAGASGVPRRISASIILNDPISCPENSVTLSLYTDDCGNGPGTELVSSVATVPTAPCDLAVGKLRNAPPLEKNKKYWVVATTNSQQAGLDARWFGSNGAQFGISAGGSDWGQFSAVTPGFLVQ